MLVAAIAAVAPVLAVLAAWNQQRGAMRRVEENTNGKLLALQAQVDGLRRLRAVELKQRREPPQDRPEDVQRPSDADL